MADDDTKWTPAAVTALVKECGIILLALVGAVAGLLGYQRSGDAKGTADAAEVRTQENSERISKNEAELKSLPPLMFGKKE